MSWWLGPAVRWPRSWPGVSRRCSCPYPYAAGDHQAKNAQSVAAAGAALTIANADLDVTKLVQAVNTLLDPEVNARMRAAALSLAKPDAAVRIADVVVELTTRRSGGHHD